ncbi:MAG TPA: transglycosylase domain-containing protein [Jiangellaceae bacterium]
MTNERPRPAGARRPKSAANAVGSPGSRRRYAASRKSAKKGRKRGWRKFVSFKAFGLYILGFGLLGVIGVGVAYAMTDVPEANDFAQSESTIVYWSDGTTELGRFNAENRESVGISDIPEHVQHAVVAAEDRSFYDNNGFDPVGILRAGIGYIRGGGEISGGGSTITQQYVKNYYLTQDQTAARKIEELFISVKIDQELDKDDILASYLNTIWFGRDLYGVQTASKSYFGKPVSELTLEEGAGLASILRSPHRYDPTLGPENAKRFEERFRYVLDGMVELGDIDQATADAAVLPTVLPEQKANRYGGPNGYLLQEVKDELTAAGITEAQLNTGGLRIVTTFDAKAQTAAINAVEAERPKENAENVHVGLAAIKPGDGAVVAMYGGPDAVAQPFNDAVRAKPNSGSTVKPFTLAAALEQGISLESRFAGNSPYENPELGPPVNNQNDADYGEFIDLVTATERSINTAYVDLAMTIGADKVEDVMVRAGIPENTTDMAEKGGRITLGIAPISTIDMADAYATIAAGGRQADWYVVKSATEPGGNVLYEGKKELDPVIDPGVAADVTYAMTQVVEGRHGSGATARELGRPSAGKTGTHQDLSAWYSGFTPQLAASVSLFRTDYAAEVPAMESMDGVAGMDTFTGGKFPAAIWTAFMTAALEGMEVEEFPEPAEVGDPVNPTPTPTPTPTPDDPTDPPTEPPGNDNGNDNGNDTGNETGNDGGGDESGNDGGANGNDNGNEGGGNDPTEPPGTEWGGGDEGGSDPTDPPSDPDPTDPPTTEPPGGEWG